MAKNPLMSVEYNRERGDRSLILDQREVFKKLQEVEDWGTIYKDLLAYAVRRTQIYHWRTGGVQILPGGRELEDLVQDVITKTFEGQRKWNPNKGPLKPWLIDQVKSEVDNLAKSATHRYEIPLEEGEGDEDFALDPGNLEDKKTNDRERNLIEAEIIDELFMDMEGHPDLERYLQAIMAVGPEPRFIADELQVPVSEIYNMRKRALRRALSSQFRKRQNE